MPDRRLLIIPLLPILCFPQSAMSLWSPESADPKVIEQVEAFGVKARASAALDASHVLPENPPWEQQFGTAPAPETAGWVREVIQTPYLPQQGMQTFSRVDVAKIKLADDRATQRRNAADALQTGVTIPEPGVRSLVFLGLLMLSLLLYAQGRGGWLRSFSSKALASPRPLNSSPDASNCDNSRSAS